MGLEQVNGQYTEGAKVQARAALIMEQLKDAHGDVIRTSGSTENQIKRMNAAFEELRVMVGTKLLPVSTTLIEKIVSARSEEHPSELQSLMRISYAVFCLKNNIKIN